MPAGVAPADCRPDARNGWHNVWRFDRLKHRYGIPQLVDTHRRFLAGRYGCQRIKTSMWLLFVLLLTWLGRLVLPRSGFAMPSPPDLRARAATEFVAKRRVIPLVPIHPPLPPLLT